MRLAPGPKAAVYAMIGMVLGYASVAQAQTNPVVVELYTSQGCAACPPADVVLRELAGREDVIALGLHVDYWDYIGWADSFGQAAFSRRQQVYARNNGRASVYTPQMIIGGRDEAKGSASMRVMGLIQDQLAQAGSDSRVTVSISSGADPHIRIEARSDQALKPAADIQLVRYRDTAQVEITGGENEGRTITYHNIVTDWQVIAQWDGVRPFQREIALDEAGPVVVIIQEGGQGPILAAARAR
ncbi:DUF1223 domain-containing protein [Roseinatronobacter sp. HJB301]|uniref:DUF1223 domain-containing protein n=2 Tax=Roseinatronobacter alkalisoli TaxID=3028235 RepID=A0ABT5TBG1_9RHOB|nr:DUF1223 domain-containing protein [Roseinatronobacter sp. HJB301]